MVQDVAKVLSIRPASGRRKSFAVSRLKIVEAAGIFPASLVPSLVGLR